MPCQTLLLSLLLLFLLLLGSLRISGAESSPHLPAPKDVMIYSYNFHSLLRWSPVKVDRGLVLYTVHFKTGAFNQWDEMNCTRITQTECSFPWSLKERRWTVVLRVRAELGQVTSDWVQTDPFVAERNTTIGPPKVNSVIVSSDSLLISVTPPFGSEAGDFLRYHVSYWENTTSTTKKYLRDPSMPGLEVLDNYAEDDPHDSLSVVLCGEGNQACGSSLDGQAHSCSVSSASDIT
ncbi:interferon gamma receptor 2 [Grus japonensis]|uniref:Interferon gamma receptor 2 n=1 Tax=Grus japonensis TaxID=30415 RepID=A0ABC9VXS6_GRUJA